MTDNLVKYWNLRTFVNSHALLGPIECVLIGIFVPITIILLHALDYTKNPHPELARDQPPPSYAIRLAKYYINRPIIILLITIPSALLMSMNQTAYVHYAMDFGSDFDYYHRVILDSYNIFHVIDTATLDTSYKNIVGTSSTSTALATFQLIYHTSSYNNLFNSNNDYQLLKDVCISEHQLRLQYPCLDNTVFSSALPVIINYPACDTIIGDPSMLSSTERSAYFQDGFRTTSSSSTSIATSSEAKVMISYADATSCSWPSAEELTSAFDDASAGDVIINYVDRMILDEEFNAAVDNGIFHSFQAVALGTVVMIIWMRGLLCGLMTTVCVIISMVSASGLLPLFQYQYYSAFNMISIYIMMGYAGTMVLMYHASWRQTVAIGSQVTPKTLLASYHAIASPLLCTTLIACTSLFAIVYSPVVIVSQVGILLCLAMIIFYIEFHLLFLPIWILSSRFQLSENMRTKINSLVDYLSGGKIAWSIISDPMDNDSSHGNHIWGTEARIGDDATVHHDPLAHDIDHHHNDVDDDVCDDEDDDIELVNDNGAPMPIETVSPALSGEMSDDGTWHTAEPITIRGPSRRGIREAAMLISALRAANATANAGPSISPSPCASTAILPTHSNNSIASHHSHAVINHKQDSVHMMTYVWRVVMTCMVLAALLLSYYFIAAHHVDGRLPQLVAVTSRHNLRDIITIIQQYKLSLMQGSAPAMSSSLIANQHHNTSSSTVMISTASYDDSMKYQVRLCWGIAQHKDGDVDSIITPRYNPTSFIKYISSSSSSSSYDIIDDVSRLCDYVDTHRDELNIIPSWEKDRDCLYEQLSSLASSSQFQANINTSSSSPTSYMSSLLLLWANQSSSAAELLGVEQIIHDHNTSSTSYQPTWLCSNFTLLTNVSSFIDDASRLDMFWQGAMTYASAGAQYAGVATISGSSAFAAALLSYKTARAYKLVAAIIISAVIVILLVCMRGDVLASMVAMLVAALIGGLALCMYASFMPLTWNVLDLAVIVVMMSMAIAYPMFMISHHRHHRNNAMIISKPSTSSIGRTSRLPNLLPSYMHMPSDAWNMMHSTLGPTVMIVVSAVPLLQSDFIIQRKSGEYMLLIISISFIVTICIMPSLLEMNDMVRSYASDKIRTIFDHHRRAGFIRSASTETPPPEVDDMLELVPDPEPVSDRIVPVPSSVTLAGDVAASIAIDVELPNASNHLASSSYDSSPMLSPTEQAPTAILAMGSCTSDDFGISVSQLPPTPAHRGAIQPHHSSSIKHVGSWLDSFRPRSMTSSTSSPANHIPDRSSPWMSPLNAITRFFPQTPSTPSSNTQHRGIDFQGSVKHRPRVSSNSAAVGKLLDNVSPAQVALQLQADIDRRLQAIYLNRQQSQKDKGKPAADKKKSSSAKLRFSLSGNENSS